MISDVKKEKFNDTNELGFIFIASNNFINVIESNELISKFKVFNFINLLDIISNKWKSFNKAIFADLFSWSKISFSKKLQKLEEYESLNTKSNLHMLLKRLIEFIANKKHFKIFI